MRNSRRAKLQSAPMAATMSAWVMKTLGFLGNSTWSSVRSIFAPSKGSGLLLPYNRSISQQGRARNGRRRHRSTKKRSGLRYMAATDRRLRSRAYKAMQTSHLEASYKHQMTQTTEPWDRRSQLSQSADNPARTAAQIGLTDAGSPYCEGPIKLPHPTDDTSIVSESRLSAFASASPGQNSPPRFNGRSSDELAHNESIGGYDDGNPAPDVEGLENRQQHEDPLYTDGEAQIVLAGDGVKECLALLLTLEMVSKINQIAKRSRRLAYITKRSKKLKREVTYAEHLIEHKKEAIQDTINQAEIAQLNEDIDETRQRMEEDLRSLRPLEEEIETLTINLEFSRAQSQEMFEDVLLRVDLLEVPEPEAAGEVVLTAKPVQGSTEIDGPEADSLSGEHANPMELDEKEITRNDFEDKRQEFIRMNEAFDDRHAEDAEEKAEYLQCVKQGICSTTQTDFDLSSLECHRRFTAKLRKAEDSFEDAFRRAKQLGVLDGEDAYYQESVFSGRSDGYAPSFEDAMTGSAPVQRISYWQQSIGQSQDGILWGGTGLEPWEAPKLESEALGMEDCEVRSATMSDSWSCVDRSRNRRRIDRWRKISGRDR